MVDGLNGDVRSVARRVEQRTGSSDRDDLEAAESLSRSSSAAVVTSFSLPDLEPLNTGSPSPLVRRGACGASSEKEDQGARCRGPARRVGWGTTRNGVEGRQPNDRREAGVLSQDTVTRRVRQARRQPIVGSIGTCQCVCQGLRSRGNLFRPSASTIRDGRRHCECKCVDQTLQLVDLDAKGCSRRLQCMCADGPAATFRGRSAKLQLCEIGLRVSTGDVRAATNR